MNLDHNKITKSNLNIVSIVGVGGLGKTTLAKEVLEELKGFNPKAFVPVGRNPDANEVLKDIIYELEKSFNTANLDVKKLVKKVKELLKNKRYTPPTAPCPLS